jgi:hypothetical protein
VNRGRRGEFRHARSIASRCAGSAGYLALPSRTPRNGAVACIGAHGDPDGRGRRSDKRLAPSPSGARGGAALDCRGRGADLLSDARAATRETVHTLSLARRKDDSGVGAPSNRCLSSPVLCAILRQSTFHCSIPAHTHANPLVRRRIATFVTCRRVPFSSTSTSVRPQHASRSDSKELSLPLAPALLMG